jgi:hypothetical protein
MTVSVAAKWKIFLAVLVLFVAPITGRAVLIVLTDGTNLVRLDSATPGTNTTVAISGLQSGETLVGLDFRPSNGVLYGSGTTGRLYSLNYLTGAATQVGAVGSYPVGPNAYGSSFNPVQDIFHLVSGTSQLDITPDTNNLIGPSGFIPPPHQIAAIAYGNPYPNASVTTLYGIDAAAGTLVTIGQNPFYAGSSNTGSVTTIGSLNLGTNLNQNMGFDTVTLESSDFRLAYAAFTISGQTRLYLVSLETGVAQLVGPIGAGNVVFRGLAVQHGPVLFANTGSILIPNSPNTAGVANPYPATITSSGLQGTIREMKLTLKDLRHHFPDDVDILLTYKPSNSSATKTMTIFSDVGNNFSTCGATCDNQANPGSTGVTIVLSDSASASLPDATALTSGTFKPTNNTSGDPFPAPAPAPPFDGEAAPAGNATFASVFNDLGPNGTWNLYINDDGPGDSGRLAGGWTLEITSAPVCQAVCPGTQVVNNTPGQCGGPVFPSNPPVTGACGALTYTPASGSFFPVGNTSVILSTEAGPTCSFTVTVNDVEKPSITCHADMTVPPDPGHTFATVNFGNPTTGDNCSVNTTSYVPASGSTFPAGTTTVTGTATDSSGNSSTCTFKVTVTPPTSLANISTRLRVETGDNVLIGGFIVTGSQAKRLILRAIGPSLPFADKLQNPQLQLFNANSAPIAQNDNWIDAPNKQEIIDSTIPPSNNLESAILGNFDPGAYTAIVSGVSNGTGVGLVEVYDLSSNADSRLANISTRGLVQTGDNALIAGTIIIGPSTQKVIVRGIGPSLPLAGNLANPSLELRDGNGGLIEANDDWVNSPNKQAIVDSTIPPSNDLESAIVQTLPAANYTAILRGVGDTTGVGVVELYGLN